MQAEGFERTIGSFRTQLSDETKETKCATVQALINDLKEDARLTIKAKQENTQRELEQVNIELEFIDSRIREEEANARISFAVEFAKLEEERIKLQGRLELDIVNRTRDERQERAVLEAQKETLLTQKQEFETEYRNPTTCISACCK